MYITFTLKNQIIKRTDKNIVVANSKNYLLAKFTFLTDDWGGTVTGIFNGFTAILDKNNECVVPWEALQFPGELMVSAFCGDRQTANKAFLPIMESGYTVRQTPEPPTPDVYQKLIEVAKNAEDVARSVREDANSGAFDGKPGQIGPQGPAGLDSPQIDDTQASTKNPWSGAKVEAEINAIYAALEKSNIQFPVAYSGTAIHAYNSLAENLTLNRNNVEILGQTIQNCLDHSARSKFLSFQGDLDEEGYIVLQANGTFKNFALKFDSAILKPNTQYTLVIDTKENSLTDGGRMQFFKTGTYSGCFDQAANIYPSVGITKLLSVTKNNFTGLDVSISGLIFNEVMSGTIKFRLALIEGDWIEKDVSWVPFGLNTPQTTEVKMCGENLFDMNGKSVGSEYEIIDGFISNKNKYSSVPGVNNAIRIQFDCLPYTDYVVSVSEFTGDELAQSFTVQVSNFGITGSKVDSRLNNVSQRPRFNSMEHSKLVLSIFNNINTWVSAKGIMISSGDGMEYKEYAGSASIISHTLCSISDTIRDRIYLKDGKAYYEKNVVEIIFDGSEDEAWVISTTIFDDSTRFFIPLPGVIVGGSSAFNNILLTHFVGASTYSNNIMCADVNTLGNLTIRIKNDLLGGEINADGLKKWLQENPVTCLYQLAEPVTSEIAISDFYSYTGQTNWYTTNAVKPTIKGEIPSNLGAVVGAVAVENAMLKQENQSMYQEVTGRMAALEETIPVMAEAANNLAEVDAAYREGVNSV